jgi:hypothetical protein
VGEQYELLEEIGRGGVGTVHRARAADGRVVAVKRLTLAPDAHELLRFVREQRLAQLLSDTEGFVPVLDTYTDAAGAPCMVLPYLPGGTLRDRLRRGPLSPAETLRIGRAVARALGQAHAAGVIHRDVKPENVLFDAQDRPLLADLGLAKHWRRDGPGGEHSLSLTGTDEVAGTWAYLPPEAVQGTKHVGPAADVFALGVVLYECLAGAPPFSAEGGLYSLLARVEQGEHAPLGAKAPPPLAAIVERCLRADPRERPRNAHQVAAALDSLVPPPREPSGTLGIVLVVGAALAIGTAGVLGLLLSRRGPSAGADPAPVGSGTGAPVATVARAGLPPGVVWTLAAGPAPRPLEPALWSDGAAWPLRPGAAAAAWRGAVEPLAGGQLRVRYDAQALARGRVVLGQPSKRTLIDGPAPTLEAGPAGARLRSPGWSSVVRLVPGEGRWADGAVRAWLDAGVPDRGGEGTFWQLAVGVGPAALDLLPLHGVLRVGKADVACAGHVGRLELGLAPRARRADRVRLVGREAATLEPLIAAAAALDPRGPAWLQGRGGAFDLERLEVEGRPLASDVPALALVEPPVRGDARLVVEAALEGPPAEAGAGGPVLALGAPPDDQRPGDQGPGDLVTLELQGDRLVLARGGRPVAEAPLPGPRPAAVRLCLERLGGLRWVGWVAPAGADAPALVALEVIDPVPLRAAPVRALYGSSGPRVRVEAATLACLREDPHQDEVDAAAAAGREPDGPRALRDAAWRGAALLARVQDPGPADGALRGPDGFAARRERLTAARAALLEAATSDVLDLPVRLDARARAALAAILAGDPDDAAAQARALVEVEGAARARARVDALEREADEQPKLVEHLLEPFVTEHRPKERPELEADYDAIDRAGLVVARLLAPDLAGRADHQLARFDRRALKQAGDRDAAGLARVLAALEAARAGGAPPGGLDGDLADVHQALAWLSAPEAARAHRLAARAAWARYAAVEPDRWWAWRMLAVVDAELGEGADAAEVRQRADLALEELIVTRAVRPGAIGDPALPPVIDWALARAGPGRRAAFYLACARTDRPDVREALLLSARAALDSADPRERDLGRYALRRLGVETPPPSSLEEERPTLALLRARSGTGDGGLVAAAAVDPLVKHLARLDPELAPLLTR